jgi:hypothetical protein
MLLLALFLTFSLSRYFPFFFFEKKREETKKWCGGMGKLAKDIVRFSVCEMTSRWSQKQSITSSGKETINTMPVRKLFVA